MDWTLKQELWVPINKPSYEELSAGMCLQLCPSCAQKVGVLLVPHTHSCFLFSSYLWWPFKRIHFLNKKSWTVNVNCSNKVIYSLLFCLL